MAKHVLIAVATSRYDHLPEADQRPQLIGVAERVVDLFTRKLQRYTRELAEIAENPPSDKLRNALARWFGSAQRNPEDWVVVYYTGHAELGATESLYLLTSDFEEPLYVATAFELGQLAEMALARRGVAGARAAQNVLFIIDTCFSGAGALDLTEALANAMRRNSRSMFYVIGAALPREEAQAGAFAEALIGAIDELSQRNVMQEFLFFDQIVPAVNRRLRTHTAIYTAASASSVSPQFFPNPSYVPTGGVAVVASEAQRAIVDAEFREHWGPRSRGVELDSQTGSYFRGRTAVLNDLEQFLRDPGDRAPHVITGLPGSGKSAILAHIVTGNPTVDVAIHGRGKTLADVVSRCAAVLRTDATAGAVVAAAAASDTPVRIVLDALDESLEPALIMDRLLRPLGSAPPVKLIVGTRKQYARGLGEANIIDIDLPEYAERSDIASYVKARLLREDEPNASTPYAARNDVAARVGELVADAMSPPNFLTARLVVEDLLARPTPIDPKPAEFHLATTVGEAFDTYLARFGANEQKVRDLLLPLAFAEGGGLPWDSVWAPLASALSGRSYGDDDVRWALAEAGAFILEALSDERSVYRLYHEALAEWLRAPAKPAPVHRCFAETLLSSVPTDGATGTRDWNVAGPYVRSYLSVHAARGGMLAEIIDPMYLLVAEPARLLWALSAQRGAVPHEIVDAYRAAVHHVRNEPIGSRAAYLELSARQRAVSTDFVAALAQLPVERPWNAEWASWSPDTPSHVFGGGGGVVTTLVTTRWRGRAVAVVGRENGAVELWDIEEAARNVHWKPDAVAGFVRAAELAEAGGEAWLVASWESGHEGVYGLDSGERTIRAPDGDGKAHATAFVVFELDGRSVCLTGYSDRFRVSEFPSLTTILERPDAEHGTIYVLRAIATAHGMRVAAGGDSALPNRPNHSGSTLRLVDPRDLATVWHDDREASGVIEHAGIASYFGKTLLVTSQDAWGPPEIWDVEERRVVYTGPATTTRSWLYTPVDDDAYLLDCFSNTITASRLTAQGSGNAFTLSASRFASAVEIEGDRAYSDITDVAGRAVVLSAAGDRVHVWYVDDFFSAEEPLRAGIGAVRSLAAVAATPELVYAGTDHGAVEALEVATGASVWAVAAAGQRSVNSMSATVDGSRLVAGTYDGFITVLDPHAPDPIVRTIATGGTLRQVRAARYEGRPIVLATIERGTWSVRAWDLESGDELELHGRYQLMFGEEDKMLGGLTAVTTDDAVRFAFAGSYAKVMVADFATDAEHADRRSGAYREWRMRRAHGESVNALVASAGAGSNYLLATTAYGHISVWDFSSGTVLADRGEAHLRGIPAAVATELGGRTVFVTGGQDGYVRLWTPQLEELLSIDIGEGVNALAPLPDGRLAVGTGRGVVMLRLMQT